MATASDVVANLKQLAGKAYVDFLAHAEDDDAETYREAYNALDDRLSGAIAANLTGTIAALTAEFDDISDATNRLKHALDTIASAEDQLARYSSVLTAGIKLVTALQTGQLATIAQAVQDVRNAFAAPA